LTNTNQSSLRLPPRSDLTAPSTSI
jgi:hypothetical protein